MANAQVNDNIERMMKKYSLGQNRDSTLALREVLQEIALVGLWRGKFFEHAAFYGGTALRILYGLDRFSEDLDFTLLDPKTPFSWASFEKHVVDELRSYGFEVTFADKKKSFDSPIQSAFLKTNTLHALLQIGIKQATHRDSFIRIKVEIDSSPTLGFDVESVYLKEPMPVSIRALKESSLFAGKIHAALYRAWKQRVKGRDWYDLIWFLRRGISADQKYLKACMLVKGDLQPGENLTIDKIKGLLIKRIKEISIQEAKNDVLPFVRDPSQLDLWSVDFFQHWIDQLTF
jgi:predicted nucleotidyltransferase component of viral defense system